MIKDLKKINSLFSKKEKRKLAFLSFTHFASGMLDLIGVVSIAPFLAIVSNDAILKNNEWIIKIKSFLDLDYKGLILFFAIASLSLIIINQLFKFFAHWYQLYLSNSLWHSLHSKIFKYYVDQSYGWHIHKTSNELLERVQIKCNAAIAGVLIPAFTILGFLITTISLFALLIYVDPFITGLLVVCVCTFYIFVTKKFKKKLNELGSFVPTYFSKTFNLTDQAFKSIKDIKIKNNSSFYSKTFNFLAKKYAMSQVTHNLISAAPRVCLEIVTYIFIFSFIIFFILKYENFSHMVLLTGIYAFSLQKIIPAAQGIYSQYTDYKYYKPTFDKIYPDLLASKDKFEEKNFGATNVSKLDFKERIELKNLSFRYQNTKKFIFENENVKISAGQFIGIVGKSGSGKTTFVDLIIGLLDPSSGEILIDGKKINSNNLENWKKNIGYVFQSSFFADDTITNNIALGINEKEIDFNKIEKVAKIAQISDFIESKLPLKYNTIIGEDGAFLSEGQKQRINIARALYNDPEMIILDEATNSLDSETENLVISSIFKNFINKTVVMITHKVSLLQNCDQIIFIEDGSVKSQGKFDSLMHENSSFKKLVAESFKKN